jgi:chemotaxis protein methyltransferase CheR
MLSDESLAPLMSAVEQRFGLVAKPLTETLRTALLERARSLRVSPTEYAARLSGPGAETEELVNLVGRLLLGHTHFYRHARVWQWLSENMKEVAERAPVRALIAGCSTGEEAYTLAASLAANYGLNGFDVTAVDVNSKALQLARHGTYLARDISKLPTSWQERYLEHCDDGTVRFHAALRSHVRFTWCNLTQGPPEGPYHLVMIRNVLTYMTSVATATILERLLKMLVKPGLLVVAPHESFLVSENTDLVLAAEALPIFRNDQAPAIPQLPPRRPLPEVPAVEELDADSGAPEESVQPQSTSPSESEPDLEHVVRPSASVLHSRSEAWTESSRQFGALLRSLPPDVVVDLSSVIRMDNQVKQSIRAAVRLLEAAGVRVKVHSSIAFRRERD